MADIIGNAEPISVPEGIKKLWIYINSKKLQDATNARYINADASMKAVFGQSKVSMVDLGPLLLAYIQKNSFQSIEADVPISTAAKNPDGHPKLPHLWPPKLLHPDWSNRLLLDGLVWPFSYGNFSLDFYKKAEWPSAARQAEGSKPGSGGQLSHRCVAPTVHGLARWSGQLFTAGACPTNLPN
ncbi:MAG: SWIB/MDM2 domain-containing protein [Rhodoferax sp.]